MKYEYKKILKEGIEQGQKETGQPLPPMTKEDREKAAVKVVAAWYVRLWKWITFQG